ncbi:MAG: hypothetical protein ABEI86_14965, partial [Halobacteriaceae archaeon]
MTAEEIDTDITYKNTHIFNLENTKVIAQQITALGAFVLIWWGSAFIAPSRFLPAPPAIAAVIFE